MYNNFIDNWTFVDIFLIIKKNINNWGSCINSGQNISRYQLLQQFKQTHP